jgi:hypothetical protein
MVKYGVLFEVRAGILTVVETDFSQTKILFVKDKLSDGFMFPPVAVVPSLNMSGPSGKTTNPLS